MYEELIKSLRICAIAERDYECAGCAYRDKDFDCNSVMKIDAADAIEELEKKMLNWQATADDHWEAYQHWFHKYMDDVPKWISVKERLPKYGDWVLGIGPKKGYHVCEYRGITHFPYDVDSPWFSAKGCSLTITHWMPLPEPPKEETE